MLSLIVLFLACFRRGKGALYLGAHRNDRMDEVAGLRQSTSPAVWDPRHLRIATEAAGIALWSWNVDTDEIHASTLSSGLSGCLRGREPAMRLGVVDELPHR